MNTKKFLIVSILLTILVPVKELPFLGGAEHRTPSHVFVFVNAEGRLGAGQKLIFSAASIYDLELLPGISDVTAKKLIDYRAKIKAKALFIGAEQKNSALELVPGIGPTLSLKLDRMLELR